MGSGKLCFSSWNLLLTVSFHFFEDEILDKTMVWLIKGSDEYVGEGRGWGCNEC